MTPQISNPKYSRCPIHYVGLWETSDTRTSWYVVLDPWESDKSQSVCNQPAICSGLVRLTTAFEEKGGLELEDALGEKQNFAVASQKLLPTLFKFVTDTHAAVSDERNSTSKQMDIEGDDKHSGSAVDGFQKLKCVTEAISVLARLAERSFLEGLFKTVMQRLLEEIQSESGDSERICALLTLSQALVSSQVLTEDSLNFLYRALKTLVRNDETTPRVQKRAYKVLHELCDCHSSFVTAEERLKELTVLLTGTIMTSQISARHMRLKCMSSIVSGLDVADESKLVSKNKNAMRLLWLTFCFTSTLGQLE